MCIKVQTVIGNSFLVILLFQVLFTTINPFISDVSADAVMSSVVNFTVDNCDKMSRKPNGTIFNSNETGAHSSRQKSSFDSPKEAEDVIEISLHTTGIEPLRVNESTRDIYKMLYHSINITEPIEPLIIAVYPLPEEFLTVYVHIGDPPSPQNYSWILNLSGTEEPDYESSNNRIFIQAEKLRNITVENAIINIGVRRQGILLIHINLIRMNSDCVK